MNFVGHHEVAARGGLDGAGRLGAMLPDLATMLGTRVQRGCLPGDVARGVELHHRTDAVFHGDARVVAAMSGLGAALAARGVARGAARAVGHIGFEMQLDGTLGDVDLAPALASAADVEPALGHHPGWTEMQQHLASRRARYGDPDWVADRLHAVLARRPRLAFPAEQRRVVAAALAEAADRTAALAAGLFADVAAAALVSPGRDRSDRPGSRSPSRSSAARG